MPRRDGGIGIVIIDDFDGETVSESPSEIAAILARRPAFDANHYILTFDETGFPQLSAFVRADDCVLYYLDGDESFVSRGDATGEGTRTFYENNSGATVELADECVVPVGTLTAAVDEFAARGERPATVRWTRL